MLYVVSDPIYTYHDTGPRHPEQAARTVVIEHALTLSGLMTRENRLQPRLATIEDVLLCHTAPYLELVRREVLALKNSGDIAFLSTGDAIISEHSYDVAMHAVGGALVAIDKVLTTPQSSAFVVVRPPGHHACSAQGMGFCLFNNIAIAARYAQQKYGIERVLIVDWDVHHGNGTQEIFYDDPTVFYFSTHEQNLYPGTGAIEETGEGKGKGTTLNCPIAAGPDSRVKVLEAFEVQLKEKMKAFRPNLVLISAGFDAHRDDPLGHFNLTDNDFLTLTTSIKDIANEYAEGRIVSVLEGGYNLQALATASVAHVRGM
jgi:acetoin utilization deacetylase AcuC-like enzyme